MARTVGAGALVGVLCAGALAWIAWADARGDPLMSGVWVVVLLYGLPAGVVLGSALGLLAGLVRMAGGGRRSAAGGSAAVFAAVVAGFGATAVQVGVSALVIFTMSWFALVGVDRWSSCRPRENRTSAV